MLAVLSALVALACVLASTRRLAWAASPTWLDPQLLADALRDEHATDWPKLRAAIAACAGAQWENELFGALDNPDEYSRIAQVNEQLRELDWLARRWARVPRVCASVATSAGFLFACLALIGGVADSTGDVGRTLFSALDALAIGIVAASFCITVHIRAQRVVRERLAAADRLVERLEAVPRPSGRTPELSSAN
jgi:hypothetical protein